MRKLILIVLLLTNALYANAEVWGVLGTTFTGRLPNYYLSYYIVNKHSLSYCTHSAENELNNEYSSLFFESAFRYWTLGSAYFLENSGRKEEFQDVIDLLRTPFTLENKGSCSRGQKTDIAIISDYNICKRAWDKKNGVYRSFYWYSKLHFPSKSTICNSHNEKDYTYISPATNEPTTIQLQGEDFDKAINYLKDLKDGKISDFPNPMKLPPGFVSILHETGHAFGLSDEYAGKSNQSKRFSSPYRSEGVMNQSWTSSLSAGDVTGIIVLMDAYRHKKRTFTPLEEGISGKIINGRFFFSVDKKDISKQDRKTLAQELRISSEDYKGIMSKYQLINI